MRKYAHFSTFAFGMLLCYNLADDGCAAAEDDVGDDGLSGEQSITDAAALEVVVIDACDVVARVIKVNFCIHETQGISSLNSC